MAYMDVPCAPSLRTKGEGPPFRNAFWCGAAGVRDDLLDPEARRAVFRHVVYRALCAANDLGYERVRCAAPWPKHPCLARTFAEYQGMSVQSFLDDQSRERFLLEWELAHAIVALEAEGAAGDLNDILADQASY